MSERTHLSIGEVLSLLQEEFPDVTISKIRFLESQGLLDPERTPSGYRKFYDADIERLRWILRQQRENFLPLKVIKDRLEAGELDDTGVGAGNDGNGTGEGRGADRAGTNVAGGPSAPPPIAPVPPSPAQPAPPAAPTEAETGPAPASPGTVAPAVGAPPVETGAAPLPSSQARRPSLLDSGDTSVSMTVDELARAAGLTARQLGELERYGLITGETIGKVTYYDGDALLAARTCASFIRHGVEARHLRMYKLAAEREAAFFEQLLLPLLRKRSTESRRKAQAALDELVGLGDTLRMLLLREALRDHLERG